MAKKKNYIDIEVPIETESVIKKVDSGTDVKEARNATERSSDRLNLILLVLFIAALALAGWFYWRYQTVMRQVANGAPAINNELIIKEAVRKAGKLFILPVGEMPQIMTITEPEEM